MSLSSTSPWSHKQLRRYYRERIRGKRFNPIQTDHSSDSPRSRAPTPTSPPIEIKRPHSLASHKNPTSISDFPSAQTTAHLKQWPISKELIHQLCVKGHNEIDGLPIYPHEKIHLCSYFRSGGWHAYSEVSINQYLSNRITLKTFIAGLPTIHN